MIGVKAWSRGEEYGLTMKGHAEYNPGNDVVCAGSSAIAFALAGYLHNCGGHLWGIDCEKLDSGDLELRCTGDEMVGEAYRMAVIGLLQLEAAYPGHVQVEADLEGL